MANHGSSPALEYLQQRVNQGQAELVKLEKKVSRLRKNADDGWHGDDSDI